MALMSSGGGLDNGKLELATAIAEDVLFGKTFYSGDKELKNGIMPNNGAWSSSVNPGSFVTIPQGYHNGNGKVNGNLHPYYAVCFMGGGNGGDLNASVVAYKVTGNDITGFNYINMSTSGRTAFDVLTFSSPRQSTEIRIVNHIRLKVIGRSAVLQGKSSVNVGPSVGSVLEAGASQTYYMQGGQSGRTVGLIIYEEI